MKLHSLLVTLILGLAMFFSITANAGIIRIELSGTVISQDDANRGLDPRQFSGYFELDTNAPIVDSNPVTGAAQFDGYRESTHPSYFPSPPFELIDENNPEFLDSFQIALGGGYFNLTNGLPDATVRRLTIGLQEDADQDRLSLEFVVFGLSVTDTQVLRLELSGDGDSLWSGTGNPIDDLSALELLTGVDLSGVQGTGSVAVSRASPFNSFTLEINSISVSLQSVPEPAAALLLLAGLGLVRTRRSRPAAVAR